MSNLLTTAAAVEQIDTDRYRASVTSDLGIIGGLIHGGALLQLSARALQEATGLPHPVTITGHYLAAVRPGDLTITTEVLRRGRHTTARAILSLEDGTQALATTATFADLSTASGETRRLREPPSLPDPADCFDWPRPDRARPGAVANIAHMFEHRLETRSFGFNIGKPSHEPLIESWARPAGGPWDPLDILTLADVYVSPIFAFGYELAWVPTVELTVHLRSLPQDDEWLACRFESRELTDGYLDEDGELRAEDGRLVAISRQLALFRTT